MNLIGPPSEVLDLVCSYSLESEDLQALSSTCRQLRRIARRLIYHTIAITAKGAYVKGTGATVSNAMHMCEMLSQEAENIRNVTIEALAHGDGDSEAPAKLALELQNLKRLELALKEDQLGKLVSLMSKTKISTPVLIKAEARPPRRTDKLEFLRWFFDTPANPHAEQASGFELLAELLQLENVGSNMSLEIDVKSGIDPSHTSHLTQQLQQYFTRLNLGFAHPSTISSVNEFLAKAPNLKMLSLNKLGHLEADVPRLIIPDAATELQFFPHISATSPIIIAAKQVARVKFFESQVRYITIEAPLSHLTLKCSQHMIDIPAVLKFIAPHSFRVIALEVSTVQGLKDVRAVAEHASEVLKLPTQFENDDDDYYEEMANALPLTSDIRDLWITLPARSEEDTTQLLATVVSRFPRLSHLGIYSRLPRLGVGSAPKRDPSSWNHKYFNRGENEYSSAILEP